MALVALAVYALHGHGEALTRDIGIYTYAGQQVLAGEPPYQGVLNRAGPLAHLTPALGIGLGRLVGVDDVLGVRLFFMLLAVAAVCAVYGFCRELFGSRVVGLAGAAALLSVTGFIHYAANGPREKTPMVLFLVLTLWSLHRHRWAWAGLWLSLATLLLQIAFPLGATAFLVAWARAAGGERWRALAAFAGGGLAPVAVFVVYFAAVGMLGDAVQAFWGINASYTGSNPPLAHPAAIGENLVYAYGWSLGVLVLGWLVVLALAVRDLRRRAAPEPGTVTLAACGGGLLVFLLWSMVEFDAWPDAFPALPVAAVGIAALAALLRTRLAARAFVALVSAWVVAVVTLSAHWSLTHRYDGLEEQRTLARATLRELPADATFFTVEAPQPLVLGRRRSVSRLQTFSGGLEDYVQQTWAGGLTGLAERVGQRETTVILLRRDEPVPAWLSGTLAQEYVEVTHPVEAELTQEWWRTYLHRSVPPRTRAEVRTSLARAWERMTPP